MKHINSPEKEISTEVLFMTHYRTATDKTIKLASNLNVKIDNVINIFNPK
jgi:energy-converting hydrogenase A subunit M